MKCTACLNSDEFKYSLKTRIYWALHGIKDWNDSRMKCTVCGKPLKHVDVHDIKNGYRRKTCSKACERMLAQDSIEKTMHDIYGVSNAFQIDCVKEELDARKSEIQAKRDHTKKMHKTFKTSRKEEEAYSLLC